LQQHLITLLVKIVKKIMDDFMIGLAGKEN